MNTYWANYYTKEQAQGLLIGWDCREPLPRKGFKIIIALANRELIEVSRHTQPSTYGKPLYKVEMKR